MEANTQEAGADVKESGLFLDAGHLEDGRLMSQSPFLEDGRLTSQSPSPPLIRGRGFYKEGEGNRTKRSREGVGKFYMQMSTVHSDLDGLVCVILASRHPGSIVQGQQISRSWDAQRSQSVSFELRS